MVFFDPRHTTSDDLTAAYDENAIEAAIRSSVNQLPPSIQASASKVFEFIGPFFQTAVIPCRIESFANGLSAHPEQIDQIDRYLLMMGQVGSDPEKILRELGAFLFFLSSGVIPEEREQKQCTLFEALSSHICRQLHRFSQGMHLQTLEVQESIPTGQQDFLITCLASLILSPEGTFSKVGALTAMALIRETSVGMYLNPEGRKVISELIETMIHSEQLAEMMEQPIAVHSALALFVKVDLMIPKDQQITQRDVKVAIIRAILWEVRQQDHEGNCYYLASFYLAKFRKIESVYGYVCRCLEMESKLLELVKIRLCSQLSLEISIDQAFLASLSWIIGFETFIKVKMNPPQEKKGSVLEGFGALFGSEAVPAAACFLGARLCPATFLLGMVTAEFGQMNPFDYETDEDKFLRLSHEERAPNSEGNTRIINGLARVLIVGNNRKQKQKRRLLKQAFSGMVGCCIAPPIQLRGVEVKLPRCLVKYDAASRCYLPVSRVDEVVLLVDAWLQRILQDNPGLLWLDRLRERLRSEDFIPQLIDCWRAELLEGSTVHGQDLVFQDVGGSEQQVISSCFGLSSQTKTTICDSTEEILGEAQKAQAPQIWALADGDFSHVFTVRAGDPKLHPHDQIPSIIEREITTPATTHLNKRVSRRATDFWRGVSGKFGKGPLTYQQLLDNFFKNRPPEEVSDFFYQMQKRRVIPSRLMRALQIESLEGPLRQMDEIWRDRGIGAALISSIAREVQQLAFQCLGVTIPFTSILDQLTKQAGLPSFFYLGDSNYGSGPIEGSDPIQIALGYNFGDRAIGKYYLSPDRMTPLNPLPPGLVLESTQITE